MNQVFRMLGACVITIAAQGLWTGPASAADAGDIAEGMQLFLSKGGCQSCHGWAGDGRKTDNQMPDGANLRETLLDRDIIVMTIKCGRPGRHMPAYDRLAYSDGRCYGMKQADLKNNPLPDPPATLQLARDRTHHGFFVCEGDQAGAHDPCEVQ